MRQLVTCGQSGTKYLTQLLRGALGMTAAPYIQNKKITHKLSIAKNNYSKGAYSQHNHKETVKTVKKPSPNKK